MCVKDHGMRCHIFGLCEAREEIFGLLLLDFFTLTATQEVEERECFGQAFELSKIVMILFVVLCIQETRMLVEKKSFEKPGNVSTYLCPSRLNLSF